MLAVAKRVLLVDDESLVRKAYEKLLARLGWEVVSAGDGADAVEHLRKGQFGVVLSDVGMPRMGGLEFLRAVREHDLDVPVVLMTGSPELESAMRAVEYGAFRYLVKPVETEILEDTLRRALSLHAMALIKREALEIAGSAQRRLGDRASLEARFGMALRLLWMAYQPIVSLKQKKVYGYEALLRTTEPTLRNPAEVLETAEQLGKVHELGRAIRSRVAADFAKAPADVLLFVNLHSLDLNDEDLYATDTPFAALAHRVVLEITERASLDGVGRVASRIEKLRAIGFRIAVDDLGAGYAGLSSFSQLEPEMAKIDMSLVQGIEAAPRKQSIVRSMKLLCDELGANVVAEGVETAAERSVIEELGFDFVQGYFFAKPAREFAILDVT
jgi:EAL domain-containing protein (putative c-di-GMP-specific phosphodiesterase class I)